MSRNGVERVPDPTGPREGIGASTIQVLLVLLLLSTSASTLLPVEEAGNLGIEISSAFKELTIEHQAGIESFILDTRLMIAQTQEERLRIIEEETNVLRSRIEEIRAERDQLILQLEEGEIDSASFAAEMRRLGADTAAAARGMGTLGENLSELGQQLAEELKARAQALVEYNVRLGQELSELGRSIAERVRREPPAGRPGSIPAGSSNNSTEGSDGEEGGDGGSDAGSQDEGMAPPLPPVPLPPVPPIGPPGLPW